VSSGLAVRDATVRLGAVDVLKSVSIDVAPGTVVGLLGPNGAGKTTLLDAAAGVLPLGGGHISLNGVDVTRLPAHRRARLGLGRTFQALELFDDLTVEENLLVAAEATRRGPPPPRLTLADRLPAALAHADRAKVALARALAGQPEVLVLDEPGAGLDAPSREALAEQLRRLAAEGLAVLLAEHDVEFVMAVCDSAYVLHLGQVIASGPPASVRHDPTVAAAYLGDASAPQSTARPASATASTEPLLAAHGLVAGYGGASTLHGVDLEVRAGEVVALLGPNGAGKTTTLRALSGLLPTVAGQVEALGAPVDGKPHRLARRGLALVPQDRAVLASLTVAENLRLAGDPDVALAAFPQLEPLLGRRAGRLSGGEQHLLALARAVAGRPRLLLVDELSLGLAPRAARHALHTVRQLADAATGAGALVVEQHPRLALEIADRAVVLTRGKVMFEGPAHELASRPDVLTRAFLGSV
jgi:branched-chain amino acid transport system ATP-binding protein